MGRRPNPTTGLGAVLRELRQRAGLKVEELAHGAGLSPGYVSKLENNRVPLPRPETIEALADALGVRVDALVGKTGGMPRVIERAYRETPAAFLKLAKMTRQEREAFATTPQQGVTANKKRPVQPAATKQLKNRLMR
jgi:transcriptional regulator with XRE-family HTH domain